VYSPSVELDVLSSLEQKDSESAATVAANMIINFFISSSVLQIISNLRHHKCNFLHRRKNMLHSLMQCSIQGLEGAAPLLVLRKALFFFRHS
jgi:hypothetical protein